jgi:hypothetical protein
MFEYAANGHFYWTKEMLRDFAEQSAMQKGMMLEEAIRALQPPDCNSADVFFERVQDNLREGQVRIIFFMEESPMELRSLVDFLNKQMERSEVLLVEARQYSRNGSRIVVPMLFGYTEQARQVKRSVTVRTAESRKSWTEASYFADAEHRMSATEFKAVRMFYGRCLELGYTISWGTGRDRGSLGIKEPSISSNSLLNVLSDGRLQLNFGQLKGSEGVEKARDRFKGLVAQKTNLSIPDDYARRWPNFTIADWNTQAGQLADALADLLAENRRELLGASP